MTPHPTPPAHQSQPMASTSSAPNPDITVIPAFNSNSVNSVTYDLSAPPPITTIRGQPRDDLDAYVKDFALCHGYRIIIPHSDRSVASPIAHYMCSRSGVTRKAKTPAPDKSSVTVEKPPKKRKAVKSGQRKVKMKEPKINCPFQMTARYDKDLDTWTLYHIRTYHNHAANDQIQSTTILPPNNAIVSSNRPPSNAPASESITSFNAPTWVNAPPSQLITVRRSFYSHRFQAGYQLIVILCCFFVAVNTSITSYTDTHGSDQRSSLPLASFRPKYNNSCNRKVTVVSYLRC